MAVLTKEQILGAKDIETVTVSVPEWGGKVIVSEMSASARVEWELVAFDGDGNPMADDWQVKLLARCIVDEGGDRLFSAEDIAELGKKSRKAIKRLYEAAVKINALGPKAVEEEIKN